MTSEFFLFCFFFTNKVYPFPEITVTQTHSYTCAAARVLQLGRCPLIQEQFPELRLSCADGRLAENRSANGPCSMCTPEKMLMMQDRCQLERARGEQAAAAAEGTYFLTSHLHVSTVASSRPCKDSANQLQVRASAKGRSSPAILWKIKGGRALECNFIVDRSRQHVTLVMLILNTYNQ